MRLLSTYVALAYRYQTVKVVARERIAIVLVTGTSIMRIVPGKFTKRPPLKVKFLCISLIYLAIRYVLHVSFKRHQAKNGIARAYDEIQQKESQKSLLATRWRYEHRLPFLERLAAFQVLRRRASQRHQYLVWSPLLWLIRF